jgi:hypothetical protein
VSHRHRVQEKRKNHPGKNQDRVVVHPTEPADCPGGESADLHDWKIPREVSLLWLRFGRLLARITLQFTCRTAVLPIASYLFSPSSSLSSPLSCNVVLELFSFADTFIINAIPTTTAITITTSITILIIVITTVMKLIGERNAIVRRLADSFRYLVDLTRQPVNLFRHSVGAVK